MYSIIDSIVNNWGACSHQKTVSIATASHCLKWRAKALLPVCQDRSAGNNTKVQFVFPLFTCTFQ